MYKYGIDVSQHQGLINWEKVKDQIDFAILRICWIGNKRNHTMDAMFDYNYNECKRLGIPVGGYVYSYAESKDAVIDGADFVLNNTQDKEFELPIFLDLEDQQISGIDVEEQTYNAIEFCNFIEQYSDCKGGVYANLNWFNNHLNKEELFDNGIDCWIAHWDRVP